LFCLGLGLAAASVLVKHTKYGAESELHTRVQNPQEKRTLIDLAAAVIAQAQLLRQSRHFPPLNVSPTQRMLYEALARRLTALEQNYTSPTIGIGGEGQFLSAANGGRSPEERVPRDCHRPCPPHPRHLLFTSCFCLICVFYCAQFCCCIVEVLVASAGCITMRRLRVERVACVITAYQLHGTVALSYPYPYLHHGTTGEKKIKLPTKAVPGIS
jgi:hypothetical protein